MIMLKNIHLDFGGDFYQFICNILKVNINTMGMDGSVRAAAAAGRTRQMGCWQGHRPGTAAGAALHAPGSPCRCGFPDRQKKIFAFVANGPILISSELPSSRGGKFGSLTKTHHEFMTT